MNSKDRAQEVIKNNFETREMCAYQTLFCYKARIYKC